MYFSLSSQAFIAYIIKGDSFNPLISNQSFAYSNNIVPAKGLYHSLFFTLLTISLAFGFLGSNKIDLFPSALGPPSDLP